MPRTRAVGGARGVRWVLAGVVALAVGAGAAAVVEPGDGTAGAILPRPVAAVDPGIPRGAAPVEVVVQARPDVGAEELAALVAEVGGTVETALPIVDGAEVRLPGTAVDRLADDRRILAVTLDRDVEFETVTYDEAGTASAFVGAAGALDAWAAGSLGDGVGVAVIDTGISEMADLHGRIVHGPDLSGEGTLVDTYGHGTVMAGIIGGSGADSAGRAGGAYTGVAPEAHLVAVKVAGANGAADVTTLLQAMHWVASYEEQFDIRVLNLSWGTPSTQDPAVDPLNHAVERLWDQGIVVVVAAGNQGPKAGTVTKPGDDPKVITVGAYNDKGTVHGGDDATVSWTSQGPTAAGVAKPDLVAPGRRLVATRSYGSTIAAENEKALIEPSYIRGSGSSQAAAVTAGAVALLLDARPDLTPDQVKRLLTSTANPLSGAAVSQQGAGRLDLAEALTAGAGRPSWQTATSTGLGSIEASRGGLHVSTDCGEDGTTDVIEGEIDVRCEPWSGSAWTGSAWTGSAWTGSAWTGSAWTGSAWTGSAWTGSAWTGSAWTGGTWTGSAWTGSAWTGSAWTGSAWTGSAWTGSAWTGSAWTGSAWTGSAWTSAAYEGDGDLFLTAWWGMNPPAGVHVAGELPAPAAGRPPAG
ncbi:MAG TPA: S8 family serine peptidase [Acidimicrobiales bacterium]|nr:S8 family serine peptidase [Acidimicrobiales bacterium]